MSENWLWEGAEDNSRQHGHMTENKESYPDSFCTLMCWLELQASLFRNPRRKWPVLACWPQVTSSHCPAFVHLCFPKLRSPWTCVKCSPCHNWNAVLFLILPHSPKRRKSVPRARSSLKLPPWDLRPCREGAYFLNSPLHPSPSFRPVSNCFTLGPCRVSSSPILSLRGSSFLQE